MSKYQLTSFLIVLLNLGTLVSSLANDHSYNPPPPPPVTKPPPPQKLKPTPPPPVLKPPPPAPPKLKPPPPPLVVKPPPPATPKVKPPPPPPVVKPPPPPPPKVKPLPPPPVVKPPPPPPKVKPPPPPPVVKPPPPPNVGYPPPPTQQTCSINALKLGACVDVLGGLIHIGLGDGAKEKCCPLLYGLADLDAAICLCTAIKIKALSLIDILVPISLQVLVSDCGKHPPAGFQCPIN
ncbi:hypothetical protein KPL71_018434 [Citrus sinensis]|uniref:Uncharacterized protein n=1 Tax=Citrus sinensis TaxID=2711 RepID=A0ACB8JY88_CITSI|nr:hypothetical protein KPL71_018434 [Citrus sinensis]